MQLFECTYLLIGTTNTYCDIIFSFIKQVGYCFIKSKVYLTSNVIEFKTGIFLIFIYLCMYTLVSYKPPYKCYKPPFA